MTSIRLRPALAAPLLVVATILAGAPQAGSQVPVACEAPPGGAAGTWLARARAAVDLPGSGVLRQKNVVRQSMNFQSDRPYPPFFSGYDVTENWYDVASGIERSDIASVYALTGPGVPRTLVSDEAHAWVLRGEDLAEQPAALEFATLRRALNPWAVLFDWSGSLDVRVLGLCSYRGEARVVLERTSAVLERLFLDRDTGLPVKTDRLAPHATWGQRHEEVVWSNWLGVPGGGVYPADATRLADGEVEWSRTAGETSWSPTQDPVIGGLPAPTMPAPAPDPFLKNWTRQDPDTIRVSADVVVLKHAAYNTVLVRAADTVFVLDAPLSQDRARQDSTWAARLFPEAPHRVLVVTDLAWPHIGGVRFWVARGAKVVSHPWSRAFLEAVVDRVWTAAPDVLEAERATRAIPFDFIPVGETLDLGSGVVRVSHIGGRAAEGALMAFLPRERFLWVGDFVQDLGGPTLYAEDVLAAVAAASLTPTGFAAQHLPPGAWVEVERANGRRAR
ncbi:MAG: hypothetical protein AMXMBFR53_35280 [Gemmatimonadota bacterium]